MINEHELLSTTDAKVWAQEFMRLFGERRDEIDEDLMLTWFACAMAAQEMEMNKPFVEAFLKGLDIPGPDWIETEKVWKENE